MPRAILLVCATAAACIVGGAAAADAHAAVIGVTTGDDAVAEDGECSLREAIQAANTDAAVDACPAGDGADLIVLGPRAHRLTIPGAWEDAAASGDLDVTSEITLRGSGVGRTSIDGGGLDRVLHVLPQGSLTLEDLTVTGGRTPVNDRTTYDEITASPLSALYANGGGGVMAAGPLTVRRCAIEGNETGAGAEATVTARGRTLTALLPGGAGGGLVSLVALDVSDTTIAHNRGGDAPVGASAAVALGVGGVGGGVAVMGGAAIIRRSTIAYNRTGQHNPNTDIALGLGLGGGGVLVLSDPGDGTTLSMEDSTIVGNEALAAEGRPAQPGGGLFSFAPVTIARSTIVFNRADISGGMTALGGQIPVALQGSLVAGNEAASTPDCNAVDDGGGNVVGTGCDGVSGTVGFDPTSLGELADHGGPTETIALLAGSLAIDAGGACDGVDQRGAQRLVGAACDAGAFEWSPCGDGTVDEGEACDDGDESAACTSLCAVSVCGDGYVNAAAGEACDDGDANSDVTPGACRADCQLPSCGDGLTDPTERCDDAGASASCDVDCTLVVCGDGLTNEAAGEACDDGDANSDTVPDACRTSCAAAGCGDEIVDSGEACDEGADNGEGVADTCRSDCRLPRCGDGVIVGDEACDDGDANSDTGADACRTTCEIATCGDGVVDSGEACDPPEGLFATLPDGCRPGCVAASCGDGAIDTGEGCDDGNGQAGDGCSACAVDAGWRCSYAAGSGSVCERVPGTGDGDTIGGDGDTTGGADTGTSGKSSGGCAGSSTPSAPAFTLLLLVIAGLTRRRRRLGERF